MRFPYLWTKSHDKKTLTSSKFAFYPRNGAVAPSVALTVRAAEAATRLGWRICPCAWAMRETDLSFRSHGKRLSEKAVQQPGSAGGSPLCFSCAQVSHPAVRPSGRLQTLRGLRPREVRGGPAAGAPPARDITAWSRTPLSSGSPFLVLVLLVPFP